MPFFYIITSIVQFEITVCIIANILWINSFHFLKKFPLEYLLVPMLNNSYIFQQTFVYKNNYLIHIKPYIHFH